MDQILLIGPDVGGARRLLASLDAHGFPPRAMVWVLLSEATAWRLWVAPAEGVEQDTFIENLVDVHRATDRYSFGVDLGRVSFVSFDDRYMSAVRKLVGAVNQDPIPISGTVMDGVFINEAVVIRMAV